MTEAKSFYGKANYPCLVFVKAFFCKNNILEIAQSRFDILVDRAEMIRVIRDKSECAYRLAVDEVIVLAYSFALHKKRCCFFSKQVTSQMPCDVYMACDWFLAIFLLTSNWLNGIF